MATTLLRIFDIKLRLEKGLQFLSTFLSKDDFVEDWSNEGLLEKVWTLTLFSDELIIKVVGVMRMSI